MDALQQAFIPGTFETTDREDVEEIIDQIINLETKIATRRRQGRSPASEEKALKPLRDKLLEKAIDPAQRPQPVSKNVNKPKLGLQSLKAIRSLYVYLDDNFREATTVNQEVFSQKIAELTSALRIDSVDYQKVDLEKTLPLSFKQAIAATSNIDESRKFFCFNSITCNPVRNLDVGWLLVST